MFNTKEELLKKIQLGEDSEIEFKEVIFKGNKITAPHRNSIADEIVAFGNAGSGIIIFGVDNKKNIIGIPRDKLDIVIEYLQSICHDNITPPIYTRIIRMELSDFTGNNVAVIKMEIFKSIYVHKSPNGYFIRLGDSKREMSPEMLARLFQQRSQTRLIRFDEQIVNEAPISALKKELWSKFKTILSSDDEYEFLTKIKFISKNEEENLHPTISGLLLASENPHQWLPGAFIQTICYKGKERNANYQIDAKDITGPLDEQIKDACKFVFKNMRVSAKKSPGRIETPQFSMNAVFEAIVNAVAHRDYSIYGSKIRLHLFSDRLELFSPGSIPNTMTIDSLPLRQVTRNENLTSFFSRCQINLDFISTQRQFLMEKRGEGVPIILTDSEKLSGKRPIYELIDQSELKLTIWSSI